MKKNAFTLIELIIVMGLFAVLASIATINLIRPQITTNLDVSFDQIVSDIKQQQLASMVSKKGDYHGIYFDNNSYTLFEGTTYNPTDSNNYKVNLDAGFTFSSINLNSNQIVFDRQNGEILNYLTGSSLTISHTSGLEKNIEINNLGVVSIN